jgi:small-conductance mechanosensitive channel
MEGFFSLQNFQEILLGTRQKFWAGGFGPAILYQLAVVGLVVLGMVLMGGLARRGLGRLLAVVIPGEEGHLAQIKAKVMNIAAPLAAAILLGAVSLTAQHYHWSHQIIYAAEDLLWAWVVIRLVTGLLISPAWSKPFAVFIMAVAAMDIVGILNPTIAVLDRVGFNLGQGRLSLWVIIKTAIMLAVLLPLSKWLCHFFEQRIEQVSRLTPRIQVLMVKLVKTGVYTLAILVALRSVGFDFHLLALFSGAVGLGVGFGLQKVVSNLVSGVIILMDNSIRPGDVIEVGGVFGWIESLHSRFISVITRDGTSYASNVHQAMELMVAATEGFPRVLANPKPAARLVNFGDSSINLDLRVWVKDPEKGVTNIKSDIQLKIWDLFHQNGIEFPFPQHDLHIKTPTELTVRVRDKLD